MGLAWTHSFALGANLLLEGNAIPVNIADWLLLWYAFQLGRIKHINAPVFVLCLVFIFFTFLELKVAFYTLLRLSK